MCDSRNFPQKVTTNIDLDSNSCEVNNTQEDVGQDEAKNAIGMDSCDEVDEEADVHDADDPSKRVVRYRTNYQEEFPSISVSRKDDEYCYCKISESVHSKCKAGQRNGYVHFRLGHLHNIFKWTHSSLNYTNFSSFINAAHELSSQLWHFPNHSRHS